MKHETRIYFTTARLAALLKETPKREHIQWDSDLSAFGLRRRPDRKPVWIVRYFDGKRDRKLKVGDPATLNPEEARKKAGKLLNRASDGEDIAAKKREAAHALTFGDGWDLYLQSTGEGSFAEQSATSQATTKQKGEKDLLPRLKHHVLGKFTAADAWGVYKKLTVKRRQSVETTTDDGKTTTAKGKRKVGGQGAARRAWRVLSAFLSWCVREHHIQSNPLIGVRGLQGDGERDVTPLTPDQFAAFIAAVGQAVEAKTIRRNVGDVMLLLLLTGARRNEIRDLTRAQVKRERGLIEIPPRKHKTGKKTGKPRVIELSPAALAILDRQPSSDDLHARMFQGRQGAPVSVNREWNAIRNSIGLPATFTPHAARHSLGSVAALAGFTEAELMRLLGHRSPQSTARYTKWRQENFGLATRALDAATGVKPAKEGT